MSYIPLSKRVQISVLSAKESADACHVHAWDTVDAEKRALSCKTCGDISGPRDLRQDVETDLEG